MRDAMRRRAFLRFALAGVGGAAVGRILLAYFSRPGENYWNGGRRNLKVGNTELLARVIGARLDCDVHRIEPVDPYPADYDETVQRNGREQDADARPAIANPLASIDAYDTILLASPIWNVRAPMIMTTFAERHDFGRKTVHPITTHAMSGPGTTPDDYGQTCKGARIAAQACSTARRHPRVGQAPACPGRRTSSRGGHGGGDGFAAVGADADLDLAGACRADDGECAAVEGRAPGGAEGFLGAGIR